MARIAGVDSTRQAGRSWLDLYLWYWEKHFHKILAELKINPDTRVKDLTEGEVNALRNILDEKYTVEGDLRREVNLEHQTVDRNRILPWIQTPPRITGAWTKNQDQCADP